MGLSDIDAINGRAWISDRLNNRSIQELSPVERTGLDLMQADLDIYENNVAASGGVPYQTQPRNTLPTLERYRATLAGELNPFGEDFFDTPESRSDTVGIMYMADAFGKSTQDIEANLEASKNIITQKHGVVDFSSALKLDIEERTNKFNRFDQINEHASVASIEGESVFDSMTEFLDANPEFGDLNQADMDQYREAFFGSRGVYQTNAKQFDKFTVQLEKNLDEIKGFSIAQAADFLQAIPKDLRPAALKYADEKITGTGDISKLFQAATGKEFLAAAGFSQQNILNLQHELSKAISTGESVLIPTEGLGGVSQSGFGSALRLMQARTQAGAAIFELPFLRKATQEEQDILFRDLQQAGDFARTMTTVQNFMSGKLKDTEGIENDTLKFVMDSMIYPATEMTPITLKFIGAAIAGNKFAAAAKLTGKVKTGAAALLTHLATVGTMQREHFDTLVARHPDIDIGIAYAISGKSGHLANGLETMTGIFNMRLIPGLGKLVDGVISPKFAGNAVTRFAKGFASVELLETGTEILQGMTLDIVQKVYKSVDEKTPNINLLEEIGNRMGEAGDIALAMVPMAVLAGGGNALIKPSATRRLLANRTELEFYGIDSKAIDQIFAATSIEEKVAILQAAYDPDAVVNAVLQKTEAGATVADMTDPVDRADMQEAQDSRNRATRDEPVVQTVRNDEGEITGYNFIAPNGNPEFHDSKLSVESRLDQWHDEQGVSPEQRAPEAKPAPAKRPAKLKAQLVEQGKRKVGTQRKQALKRAVQRNKDISAEQRSEIGAVIDKADTEKDLVEAQRILARDRVEEIIQENPDMTEEEQTALRDLVEKGEFETPQQLTAEIDAAVKEGVPVPAPESTFAKGSERVTTVDEKGETVEQAKPPVNRAEDQTETPETATVGIKNAKTKEVLTRFGANLPEKSKVRFADILEEAQQEAGLVESALVLAERIIIKPDVSSAKEQAAMLIRLHDVLNQVDTLETSLVEAFEVGDKSQIKILEFEIEQREAEAIKLSTASQLTGTEIARSLSFRQVLLDRKTGNIVRIKRAAKRAGKGKISPKIEKKLEKLALELDKALSKIEELAQQNVAFRNDIEKQQAEGAMTQAIKKRSNKRRQSAPQRRKNARELLDKMGYC